jgi:hypothetical protein
MRFDKETRAKIHEAAPNSVTIKWPAGAAEPQKGRVYWLQSLEEAKRDKERLEYSPPKQRDVLAAMHFHFYEIWPEGYEPTKRKGERRKPDDVILVLDVKILDRGWEATVVLFEDPDPVRHTGLKTKVRGGDHPTDKQFGSVATELEPEKILVPQSRREREEQEDVLTFEHEASVDEKKIAEKERTVHNLRRRGKRSTLAETAVERAKRRAALNAADGSA